MAVNFGFKYRGHLLSCDPMKLTDGRYGAQVTVQIENAAATLDARFPALGEFATENEAVEFAHKYGMDYVDRQLGK
jgi:hypothetical protein